MSLFFDVVSSVKQLICYMRITLSTVYQLGTTLYVNCDCGICFFVCV